MSHLYFSSGTDRVITGIVSTILDQPGMRMPEWLEDGTLLFKNGVLIEVTLEVYDDRLEWEKREDTKAMRNYFFAFCGNTNVFVARRDKGLGQGLKWALDITTDEWINLGNHDSCWRDSVTRFLSEVKGEMCDEVNPEALMAELQVKCDIGFAGRLWQMYEMTTDRDPEKDSYWRKLIKLEGK